MSNDNDVLVKNLDALGLFSYISMSPITEDNYHAITPDVDTCAQYSFFDPMTESQRGTPRDQSAWVLEEFPTAQTPCAGLTGLPTRTI